MLLDADGNDLSLRQPGRPRTNAPRKPSLASIGISRQLGLRLQAALDALASGNEVDTHEAAELASFVRRSNERAAEQAAHRSDVLKGVARPRNEYRVTRTIDGETKEWRYKTNAEAAERVGLTDLTLRQYMGTDAGGPRGQWASNGKNGVQWHVERVPIGTKKTGTNVASEQSGT